MDDRLVFNQGNKLFQMGNYLDAVSKFQHCIEKGMYLNESYTNLGVCYESMKDIPNAFQTYTRALDVTNDKPRFDECIKRLSVQTLPYVDILQTIVRMYPSCYATNTMLSSVLIQNVLHTKNNVLFNILKQTCSNELRLRPTDTLTLTHVGYMYYIVDENVEAIRYLNQILDPAPDVHHITLVAKLKVGKYAEHFLKDIGHIKNLPQWKLTIKSLVGTYYNANDPANALAKQNWLQYNTDYLKEKEPHMELLHDWKGQTHVKISGGIPSNKYSEKDTYLVELKNKMLHNYFIYDNKFVYTGEKAFTQFSNRGPVIGEQIALKTPIFPLNQTNVDNYYHWNAESLTRFLEFKELSYAIGYKGDISVTIPAQCSSFVKESLEFLGAKKIIQLEHTRVYQCEKIYMIDYKAIDAHKNDVLHAYSPSIRSLKLLSNTLRSKLAMVVPTKIVYARRTGIRSVQNDQYLIDILAKKYGEDFVVFEHGTYLEQANLFSKAKIVFGPHGAGLTNMLFCPKSACIMEFQMSPICNLCFEYVANALNLKYVSISEIACYYYEKYNPSNDAMDKVIQRIDDQVKG